MTTFINGRGVPRRVKGKRTPGGRPDDTAYMVQYAGHWRRVRYAMDSAGLYSAAKYVTVQGQPVPVLFDPPL